MKRLTIINQKGGVGKSTIALNIGAGLMLKRKKVLFIDLDAQGNISDTLGADTSGYNSIEVLQKPGSIKENIQHTDSGDIIASSSALSFADNPEYFSALSAKGKEYKLREALKNIEEIYDYCIIDTPPALGILSVNALTASDGAIIPALADFYSIQAVGKLNNTIQNIKRYCNPGLTISGIVVNHFKPRSVLQRELMPTLEKTAKALETKVFKARIRECQAISDALMKRQSVFKYAPRSNAAVDFGELVKEILKK